ncbi:MAG: HipA N-terminal domain-containing protein [Eggerthellaceae bacterium]|nr:HipA N-terminal domain-containing protein [Eggerthellaceae bacterium]
MNLIVYSRGAKAGVLDMADGEPFFGFTYDAGYLASGHAELLSLSLPLQEGRFDGAGKVRRFSDAKATVRMKAGKRVCGVNATSPGLSELLLKAFSR